MRDVSTSRGETVFLFPGQGSQYYQMGRELFDADDALRRLMKRVDQAYAAREGRSLLAELYGPAGRSAALDDITLSHPLVVLLEYCIAVALAGRGIVPDLVIGSSVGEFAAHAFAGRMTIERALAMVTWQARFARAHIEEGFMVAVMAPRAAYEQDPGLRALAELAGIGMPEAMVLSGARATLEPLEAALRERGLAYSRLPVRVPFHHSLIEPMRAPWLAAFGEVAARAPSVPLLGHFDAHAGGYAHGFWDVLRQPFDFPAHLADLDRRDPGTPRLFIDVGPGGTLANWIRHGGVNRPHWQTASLLSPFGGDVKRWRALAAPLAA